MLKIIIKPNQYSDSVSLMQLSKKLSDLDGVEKVSVMMGSPANKEILENTGFAGPELADAGPGDLIVGIVATDDATVDAVLQQLEVELTAQSATRNSGTLQGVRSLSRALSKAPQAELALVSIPGDHRGMIETPALVAALARSVLRAQGRQADGGEPEAVALDSADPRVGYLRQVWKELLHADVAADDNFFALGGNSMLAVQMSSRVARETGARIALMRLTVQTLAQVAAELPAVASAGDGMGSRMARRMKRQ